MIFFSLILAIIHVITFNFKHYPTTLDNLKKNILYVKWHVSYNLKNVMDVSLSTHCPNKKYEPFFKSFSLSIVVYSKYRLTHVIANSFLKKYIIDIWQLSWCSLLSILWSTVKIQLKKVNSGDNLIHCRWHPKCRRDISMNFVGWYLEFTEIETQNIWIFHDVLE